MRGIHKGCHTSRCHHRIECGANSGIDPQTGKQRSQPLLYPTPIIGLKEVQDIIVFLPNCKHVDLRPSIEAILVRGHTLGFGERHLDAIFKLLIQQHFEIYAGIFNNGTTANDTFEHLLVVLRSHNVANTLTDYLKRFSRLPNQSFAEFATILSALAFRTVQETHLQMSNSEASEYAQGKILNHITCFTSPEVQKIFDSQRSTALKSNINFYSFDGAAKTVQKIELFIKPLHVEYKLPHELYRELTSDSSLHNTVMLQAIKLSQASAPIPPLLTDVSPAPVYATNAQPRPAYKGLGGRPTTPPHNSTAQYRARSPGSGRPFTPSGTSKQIGNGSSPIGHQSR